ncbi:predicted protein [Naegleria gruberi]|uniref:Predicted protein n=1 Tax=Naegleria gruberi TaxID=5762 RepID=D2V3I0_NAEGR|nr:uncharacterized protein NAEGRDRAFT_63370 [Naegleria gruberi]EFC48641.1 predicted protein [Naegleria gruberi]|eukprot:XP_002681385.1 predicted protein [Naegleria gruberi strain NEG-M]
MYTFILLFLFSVYNSIVFFERKRTYQIFNSNINELDNLYSINKKDETNFTRGNFFNERPRPGIPNFRKSVHPLLGARYEKEHQKPFILIRLFKMILGILEIVFHFLTVGALRNKRVRKSRLFKEREKVNRMTYSEKKRQEEIDNRPANMTTYYDDMLYLFYVYMYSLFS